MDLKQREIILLEKSFTIDQNIKKIDKKMEKLQQTRKKLERMKIVVNEKQLLIKIMEKNNVKGEVIEEIMKNGCSHFQI